MSKTVYVPITLEGLDKIDNTIKALEAIKQKTSISAYEETVLLDVIWILRAIKE